MSGDERKGKAADCGSSGTIICWRRKGTKLFGQGDTSTRSGPFRGRFEVPKRGRNDHQQSNFFLDTSYRLEIVAIIPTMMATAASSIIHAKSAVLPLKLPSSNALEYRAKKNI